ncbi:MAG: MFS transporter [Pirellulales bacterium]|nr:MFS transporter [Pirellulales bacterium]
MITQNTIKSPRRNHKNSRIDAPAGESTGIEIQAVGGYGTSFWFAYLANMLIMTAYAILFRYADLVTMLGGTEFHLGWIVGIGTVGSLFTRLALGSGIDRNGPRLIWMGSAVLFSASCFGHLTLETCQGPWIYILRICMASGIAGIFGASMAMVSGRAQASRMAEMLGMLGTAGFLGMVIGTQLGDILMGTDTISQWQVDRMFVVAGSLGLFSLLFIWAATHGTTPVKRTRRPPLLAVLRRYHPGNVLLVGMVMGVTIGMPTTFLRTYAADLEIARIALFFSVYAPVGFLTRILTRRLPERFGTTPMILVGLIGLAISQFLFLGVRSEWGLIVPGIGYGISHAILFPCVIASGSSHFPERYRGLAMMVMLAAYDMGVLVGAPASGLILHFATKAGMPSYPSLFCLMALLLATTTVVHAASARRRALAGKRQIPRRQHFATSINSSADNRHLLDEDKTPVGCGVDEG